MSGGEIGRKCRNLKPLKLTHMTTQEIANRLVTLCRKGEFETAQRELFAKDAVSIEPWATEEYPKETHGLEAIYEKGRKFEASVEETYAITVSEPLLAQNSFAVSLQMDIKMKGQDRFTMGELCVYKVKNGKIVSEEFFM